MFRISDGRRIIEKVFPDGSKGLVLHDGLDSTTEMVGDILRPIFLNGKALNLETLGQIRSRLHG